MFDTAKSIKANLLPNAQNYGPEDAPHSPALFLPSMLPCFRSLQFICSPILHSLTVLFDDVVPGKNIGPRKTL
jgi:hypothetical protein